MANPPDKGTDRDDRERRGVERILPEVIRRLVESGYEKLSEGPESLRQLIAELRLPKETLALLLSQLEDTRSGLYRAVAREVREFLEHASLPEELARALTRLSLEIRTEVRFVPNDPAGTTARPDIRSRVAIHREGEAADDLTAVARRSTRPGPQPGPAPQDALAESAPPPTPARPQTSGQSQEVEPEAEDGHGRQE